MKKIAKIKVLADYNDDFEFEYSKCEVFMEAEKPFLMRETIQWIDSRIKKKKHDKKFMEKFELREIKDTKIYTLEY